MYGYTNRVIRVDLSKGKVTKEELKEDTIHNYIGGIGIGVRVVYDEVPPGVDALDPENRLVLAVGPLTGTAVPGSCRYHLVGKSPQTTFTISVADSGGFFAPEFKFAGYDAMIIQGAAEKPVYIWIKDEAVEIRDAAELWGKDTFETDDAIREMLGDERIRVAAIGPAGENLVRLACVVNDKGHVAGRGGFGAIMGSKKLKAIAVRGSGRVPVKDRKRLIKLAREWRATGIKSPLHKWGTGHNVESYYKIGALPGKNLSTNVFEYEKLTGQYIRSTFKTERKACFNCYMNHGQTVEVTEGPYKGFVGEEPEYELLAGFGSNLGVTDPGAVAVMAERCDRMGLDALGTSWTISMTMEAYEKGLVTKEKLGGLDLKWGNTEAVLDILDRIAHREGIGDVLAEGSAIAAERIGGEAQNYVVAIKKNMSPKCIDIRGLIGRSLAFAVAGSGPTTEHAPSLHAGQPDYELGFPEGIDMRSPDRQAEAVRKGGLRKVFIDSLGICQFPISYPPLTNLVEAFEVVTGRRISFDEAMTAGERILNLQRCFNIRHGLTPENDDLSERLLTAPTGGPAKGVSVRKYLKGMVQEYYQLMGWDLRTGKPLRSTLKRLGLRQEEKDIWG